MLYINKKELFFIIPFDFNYDIQNAEISHYPSFSYKLNVENEKILGTVNGLDAIKQAVYKMLDTQRYSFEIYDRNYGIYTQDLFGKNIYFVQNEIARRIKDALLCDDRISDVTDFCFDITEKSVLSVKFTVKSVFGSFDTKKEVDI